MAQHRHDVTMSACPRVQDAEFGELGKSSLHARPTSRWQKGLDFGRKRSVSAAVQFLGGDGSREFFIEAECG